MEKKTRSSNIELLRVAAALGVIILHYNNKDIGGGFGYVQWNSINPYLLYFLESMAICAVNVFILISGYFMCTSYKRNLSKPIELLLQLILFRELVCFMSIFLQVHNGVSLSEIPLAKKILINLVPDNYFVILYVVLYLVSVYINIIFSVLDRKQMRRMILVMGLLFSVWPTLVDISERLLGFSWSGLSSVGAGGSQGGYTIVNFVLMYCIGAYIRLHERDRSYSGGHMLLGYGVCVVLLTAWQLVDIRFGTNVSGIALEYCNPLVIASAVYIFFFFKQIQLKESRVINTLAKGSFSVYLLHIALLPFAQISRFCNANIVVLIAHIAATSVGIYLICWGINCIYTKLMKPFHGFLENRLSLCTIDMTRAVNRRASQ